jgi:hypothetical protein
LLIPETGDTSIVCSHPTIEAGTPLYTRSTSHSSPISIALTMAEAWTPVPVRNASRPTIG